MSNQSIVLLAFALVGLAGSSVGAQAPDTRFRSGLTATVVASPPVGGHACRQVSLRWPTRSGATTYRALTAASKDGVWTALGAASPCGAGRITSPTTALDPQPEPPATSSRRLFYRVIAIGPAGAIDTTDVVPVELTASAPPARHP